MDFSGRKTFALVAVVILCACAFGGVAYAAMAGKIVSPGQGDIDMLELRESSDSGKLNVVLGYYYHERSGHIVPEFSKDLSTVAIAGMNDYIHFEFKNKTRSDFVFDGNIDLSKLFSVGLGNLAEGATGFPLPISTLNGLVFKVTVSNSSESTSYTCTLSNDGTATAVHDDENTVTVPHKADTISSATIKVTVPSGYKSAWTPGHLTSQVDTYGKTIFDVILTVTKTS